jgi:hypoxanthine phosphoribosyltransferase
MSKIYYTDKQIRTAIHSIIRDMNNDGWRPDYIVGLNRGGLAPAVMLSHYLQVPMYALDVSFRDNSQGPESNLWMASDAFGYIPEDMRDGIDKRSDATYKKNILIVDDINDTGRTLKWIQDDWKSSCLPHDPAWDYVWGNNVRTAVIIDNQSSDFEVVDYSGFTINKLENPVWVVFPWEAWWEQ